MFFYNKFSVLLIAFILTATHLVFCTTTPTTLLVQANISVSGISDYSGTIDLDIGIYEEDVDDPALWTESFTNVQVTNGSFYTILGDSDTLLYAEIFNESGLRIGFTTYINGVEQTTEYIDLMSVPYSFHSEIASQAEKITSENIIYFDTVNNYIGINNTSPNYTLDVVGTINATTFVGDGSLITNIQVSDSRLVWQQGDPDSNIYYISGNVGIGTDSPSNLLDVSGNARISGNLYVNGEIFAEYLSGDGSQITSLNADEIRLGVLNSDRVSGNYTGITGVGTITEGIWNGTTISDEYINDNLTLSSATLSGTNYVSGDIIINGTTIIDSDSYDLSFLSPSWEIDSSGDAEFTSLVLGNLTISDNSIESSSLDGFQINPTGYEGLYISPSGSIGINTTSPNAMLDINGGIIIGSSDATIEGMIRYADGSFEGYRLIDDVGSWVSLDYDGDFDSNALHAEGELIKNRVYVNSSGNVGIGGITDADDQLVVSGNVVFRGRSIGSNLPELVTSGNGTRMVWYPKMTAFRAGYVDTTEWDSDNIGLNSIVFGYSGLADEENTVILGGKDNQNHADGGVIVGGYNNMLESDSNYSVIIGGGSSSGAGNTIDGGEYSSIIGGQNNTITGSYSSVFSGKDNTISGDYSFAFGENITITNNNTFIFSDGQQYVNSSSDGQFIIYAQGGVGINTEPTENYGLSVSGTLSSTYFSGDGSQLVNVSVENLDGYSPELVASPDSIYVSDSNGYLPDSTVDGDTIVDGSIDESHLSDDSVNTDHITNYTILTEDIANDAITTELIADGAITTDKLQDNAIVSSNIEDGSIVSDNIAALSIYEYHIVDDAVTNAKIAVDTIDTTRIVDETITSLDIAENAITNLKIMDNAIQTENIALSTIISDNISVDAIQNQHLADYVISSRNIADDAVYSSHIVDYTIINDDISDNAIEYIHIDSSIITTDRIFDETITSAKISDNAILTEHLTDDIVTSKHIDEDAIYAEHISTDAIDGARIATNTITSDDIADSTIISDNIALDAINSTHVLDYTIVSADIQDETITSVLIATGSITSDLIATGSILYYHVSDNAISDEHIATGTITWEKLEDEYIPTSFIEDGSIPGSALEDESITSAQIADESITSAQIAEGAISSDKISGVIPVSKGGTGSDSFDDIGAVMFAQDISGEVVLTGNSSMLFWDNTNNYLGVNTDSPQEALHVSGNIWANGGSVYFGSSQTSITFEDATWLNSSGYIVIGPNDDTDLPQGGLQVKDLYVQKNAQLGFASVQTSTTNVLDIYGNVAIGSDYAGVYEAPSNGLIVSGYVGIGESDPDYQLHVDGGIKATKIYGYGGTTGIYAEGGSIGIYSSGSTYGIKSEGSSIGIQATTTGESGSDYLYGALISVENASSGSHGVYTQVLDSSGDTVVDASLGYYGSSFAAAIYATEPDTDSRTNWAAYLDGPVKLSGNIGIGLDETVTPDANLHVNGTTLVEGIFSFETVDASTSIDWSEGGHLSYSCAGSTSFSFSNDPFSSTSKSTILNLKVSIASGCSNISISSGTGKDILWEKADDYSDLAIDDSTEEGYTYFYSFYYDGSNYYGLEPLIFQD